MKLLIENIEIDTLLFHRCTTINRGVSRFLLTIARFDSNRKGGGQRCFKQGRISKKSAIPRKFLPQRKTDERFFARGRHILFI